MTLPLWLGIRMKSKSTMLLVASLLLAFTSPSAIAQSEGSRVRQVFAGLDLEQAPVDFKNRVSEIEKELKEKGGFVVAGKVEIEKDATPNLGEYAVALKFAKSKTEDTYRHSSGWFISRLIPKDKVYETVLVVATFRQLPVEVALTLEEGKVNWTIATLCSAPPQEQALISGTVTDELGKLVEKAEVRLRLERSKGSISRIGELLCISDAEGKYSFDGVTFQDYTIFVSRNAYSSDTAVLTATNTNVDPPSAIEKNDKRFEIQGRRPLKMMRHFAKRGRPESSSYNAKMILGSLKAITIDYEYNHRNYFTGDVITKDVVWRDNLFDTSRIKFAAGTLYVDQPTVNDDLCLLNKEGDMFFRHVYFGLQKNGHYDLGEVPFESVDKIDEARAYKSRFQHTPCLLNHVYGVKTYDGKYAKFVVRKIELLSDLEKARTPTSKRP